MSEIKIRDLYTGKPDAKDEINFEGLEEFIKTFVVADHFQLDCRQGLDVHSVGLGVGCKSMARTMKSHPFTSRIIQNSVQALMGRGWTHGQVFFLWGWKHPS